MKKLFFSFIFAWTLSSTVLATTYTSAGVGPAAWNVATSWSPNGIPTLSDDVIIAVGHTITINTLQSCANLTVNGTLLGTSGLNLRIYGNYILNGTEAGNGAISFFATGGTISGTGPRSITISYTFAGNSTRTIVAGAIITKTGATAIATNAIVTNLGTVTLGVVNTVAGATFINSTNASLTIKNAGFMSGRTFTAIASGNTVTVQYTTGAVPLTTSGYYNLKIAGTVSGTKTLAANTIVAKNLTINSNNTLNSNNFDLSVGGNWLNNGTFTASAGKTVTFNGTTAQTVSNTLGTTTFKGIAVNNNAGVTLTSGTYKLDEVLTVTSGTFNTGGRTFTMTSTATQTARIAPILGSGAIAGNFIIQRYITTRDTSYVDFSSPVQTSIFADWANELVLVNYDESPPSSVASAGTYDEASGVYVPVTSAGTFLTPGQGFEVFLSAASYANFPATTMNTIGVPNQGDFDLSLSISNTNADPLIAGWNLVGNPYASSISWTSIYNDPGTYGLYDYIEMYDWTIGDWHGYTSASGIEIGATQGFWVYGLPGNVPVGLYIPESSKTTSSNSTIKSVTKPNYFSLKFGSASSYLAHTFKVSANDIASDGLDNKDFPFRASPNTSTPQMYSIVDGKKININNFNSSNENYSIPLKTKVNESGNYVIEASGFEFVSDYTCIKLQDNLTGKLIDLNAENKYAVAINSTDNADRFTLLFSKDGNCRSFASANSSPSSDFGNQVEILPSAQGNIINFNLAETTSTKVSIVNVLGQTIVEPVSMDANTQSLNISLPANFSGMYFIKIESAKGTITKKFVRK